MEIEKKYILPALPFDMSGYEAIEIKQAYISKKPTIRLRQANNRYILTVKGKNTAAKNSVNACEEFELELTGKEFLSLYNKIDPEMTPIEKTRYLVPLSNGLTAELDQYHGKLEGFFTAEVEFANIEAALSFTPPAWFGQDVSGNDKYSNSSLAAFGLPLS